VTIPLLTTPTRTLELRWAAGADFVELVERELVCSHWHQYRATITPTQLAYAALMVALEAECRQDTPMLAREEAERRAEGDLMHTE
jgi:hypothetical protein